MSLDIETNIASMSGQIFKPTCEQCGSLTVALPVEASPDPCSILKCGRCGSPRGTLQSLRDTSVRGEPVFGVRLIRLAGVNTA
jgi:NAD-dependent SIR2 family protein deacetylase